MGDGEYKMKFLQPVLITIGIIGFELTFFFVAYSIYENELETLRGQIEYYHILYNISILSSLGGYFLSLVLFTKKEFNESIQELKKTKVNSNLLLTSFLAGIGAYLMSLQLIEIDHWLIPVENDDEGFEITSPEFFPIIWVSVIIKPIIKELIYRRFFITDLLKSYSDVMAISVSTICFCLYHYVTHNLFFCFIPTSITASLVFIRTKKIIYPIAIHFLYLLIVELADTFSFYLTDEVPVNSYIVFLIGIVMTLPILDKTSRTS